MLRLLAEQTPTRLSSRKLWIAAVVPRADVNAKEAAVISVAMTAAVAVVAESVVTEAEIVAAVLAATEAKKKFEICNLKFEIRLEG
jgi:hypothetical protein